MIKLKVKGVSVDEAGHFFVILMDDEETKILPIGIGKLEAQNIAIPIQGVTPPRPMTHDLLKSAIEELGGKPEKVVITEIKNDTYFAEVHIDKDNKDIVLDSRPSDAIALAVRCDIPIFMSFPLIEFTYNASDVKLI